MIDLKRLISLFMAVFVFAASVCMMLGGKEPQNNSYIKYVEFNVTQSALQSAIDADIATQQEDVHIDCVTILAYLGAKYGGDFSKYRYNDINELVNRMKNDESIDEITKEMKYYKYYLEAYGAAINGMVGKFEEENSDGKMEQKYGIRWFSPIAKTFPYSSYDDFGAMRTYGYTRPHLGHDMMAAVGTPIIAVESGTVECMGWNMYGGWRIGIRSHDKQRYWYYAHLRQNRPYAENLKEGSTVTAGDVIGYVGRTGYSNTENVNGITESHLHIGLELVFDESQKESENEIWISLTAITEVANQHKSAVLRNNETKEFTRQFKFNELE